MLKEYNGMEFRTELNNKSEKVVTFWKKREGGSGFGRTLERLKRSCNGAILLAGKLLNDPINQEELKAWVDSVIR